MKTSICNKYLHLNCMNADILVIFHCLLSLIILIYDKCETEENKN